MKQVPSSTCFKRRFGGTCRLHLQGRRIIQVRNQHEARCLLVSRLAFSSTVKIQVTYSSETSVVFQRTIRNYIPADTSLQNFHSTIQALILCCRQWFHRVGNTSGRSNLSGRRSHTSLQWKSHVGDDVKIECKKKH
jgi:hypothetical protein